MAAGLATTLVGLGLITAGVMWMGRRPPYNVEVLANGADVTRAGGRWLAVENNADGTLLAVVCNGVCDDFGYRLKTVEDEDVAYRVRVAKATRECLACSAFMYVQPAIYGMPHLTQWRLSGAGPLDAEPRRLNIDLNGVVTPLVEPAAPAETPK
ncbi:hypothetical protein [Phenylobacterium sp.]|uniref:hypothetical protein n=1 Tax=Phenylobacterium sp. TaxID=1871053 RepID=UPI0025D5C7E2|nr:hypothetical protein [Phenylobacterium sp.]